MESDEVMLTVRLTTAERTLLRWLARGHRGDVSEVAADALLDVLPALLARPARPARPTRDARDAPPAAEPPVRAAPCAVTVWLPSELADLLPALAAHLASAPQPSAAPASAAPPPAAPSPCTALGTALRLWLHQDPARLAAGLRAMHVHPHPPTRPHPHVHPLAA
ncbi:hypothetical protein Kpho02_72360 [Kitasatospora phosalacinea]|uniref:Uncharacterized protein n=1 Tax=Kitasatospora phosalacinea TaxID=2065 RepID=A0A9W6QF21_9ACTN|nr:hypothetical protein [Kitasatospora phosalacinea]GLW74939.1 hypothetical protein Kpho02_72360 [Kitasatospora phosalacinea]